MDIPGVPDSVPWPKIEAFLESLGLDLGWMPARHGGIVIGDKDISCVVLARNADGERYYDRATGKVATHQVRIPFYDAPWLLHRQVAEPQTCGPVHIISDGQQVCDCELNSSTDDDTKD